MNKIVTWIDIPATDIERAVSFYKTVLGVELTIINCGEEKMACFPGGDGAISVSPGFTPSKNGTIVSLTPNHSLDKSIGILEQLGAEIVLPKTKIEAEGRGYFILMIDSEGNKVGLYGDE